MNQQSAIVLDIDGVILDTLHVHKDIMSLNLKGDEKWEYFYNNCNSDTVTVIHGIKEFLNMFYNKCSVILSTARNDKCKEGTERKLRRHGIIFQDLYMRKNGDLRSSSEVKREHLTEIMKNYNILVFIDDELSNCEMAKELGIFSLRKV